MKERRKYTRVKIKSMGEAVRQEDNTRFKVIVGDISFGGMELFSEDPFEEGERLEITISILTGKKKNIEETFSGSVRWVQPFNEAFIGGFQFDQLVEKDTYPEVYLHIMEAEGYLK